MLRAFHVATRGSRGEPLPAAFRRLGAPDPGRGRGKQPAVRPESAQFPAADRAAHEGAGFSRPGPAAGGCGPGLGVRVSKIGKITLN